MVAIDVWKFESTLSSFHFPHLTHTHTSLARFLGLPARWTTSACFGSQRCHGRAPPSLHYRNRQPYATTTTYNPRLHTLVFDSTCWLQRETIASRLPSKRVTGRKTMEKRNIRSAASWMENQLYLYYLLFILPFQGRVISITPPSCLVRVGKNGWKNNRQRHLWWPLLIWSQWKTIQEEIHIHQNSSTYEKHSKLLA